MFMVSISDDLGMNYVEKGYDELLGMYLDLAGKYGLIKNHELVDRGNVLVMELAIHSKILEQQYKELRKIRESMDLMKAHGKDLDVLLEPLLLRCVDEDDESYRHRGRYWKELNIRGTRKAVEDAIENVETVRNYYIETCWDGPGTTRIIIDSPRPDTLEQVKGAVKNVSPIDTDITFVYAKEKPLKIDLRVNIELEASNLIEDWEKETETMIRDSLKSFIEGHTSEGGISGGLGLGKDFIPSQATAYLINTIPNLNSVEIASPRSKIRVGPDEKAILGEVEIDAAIDI